LEFGFWNLEFELMQLLIFFLISFLISTVPFSVALSSSIYRCILWKEALRIALAFALFQAGMLLTGWVIGYGIKGLLNEMAVPVGALIILYIGVRMLIDSRKLDWKHRTMINEHIRILLGFAFVISINTVFLSMGLGILYHNILFLAGFVFVIVFLMTIIGVQAGKQGMMNLGRTAELIGGAGLIIICAIIVLNYLKIL
jgi:putative Mn2+ efflux pump MntP